jgi:hypothetical protein
VSDDLIYSAPPWITAPILLVVLLVATEVGFRAAAARTPARARRKSPETASADATPAADVAGSDFGVIQGAVLGLLGLLLAFTYSFVAQRADTRKQAIVREANAIGTAWLRANYYQGEPGLQLRSLLRSYAESRVLPDHVGDTAALRSAVAQSQERLTKLWPATLAAVRAHTGPPTPIDALMLQSMNDVYDSDTLRIAANRDHLPAVILVMLVLVAGVSLGVTGYAGGLAARRSLVMTSVLAFMITAVTYVILDLDHPRSGLVRVSQAALTDTIRSMEPPPATPQDPGNR